MNIQSNIKSQKDIELYTMLDFNVKYPEDIDQFGHNGHRHHNSPCHVVRTSNHAT